MHHSDATQTVHPAQYDIPNSPYISTLPYGNDIEKSLKHLFIIIMQVHTSFPHIFKSLVQPASMETPSMAFSIFFKLGRILLSSTSIIFSQKYGKRPINNIKSLFCAAIGKKIRIFAENIKSLCRWILSQSKNMPPFTGLQNVQYAIIAYKGKSVEPSLSARLGAYRPMRHCRNGRKPPTGSLLFLKPCAGERNENQRRHLPQDPNRLYVQLKPYRG